MDDEEEEGDNDALFAKSVFNRFRSTSFATDATPKRCRASSEMGKCAHVDICVSKKIARKF